MQNCECPDCGEIGWGMVRVHTDHCTITYGCKLCGTVTTKNFDIDDDTAFHKALLEGAVKEIVVAVSLLGSEVMEITGWDDCATYNHIRTAAGNLIPEGC